MDIKQLALDLVDSTNDCILGTISSDGYPIIVAMIKVRNESLKKVILSTHLYTEKIENIRNNNKVSVYFYDLLTYKGCLLKGTATVEENNIPVDMAPDGISKNDLCIINIDITDGNYFADNSKTKFTI
jgi:general stress protein 26